VVAVLRRRYITGARLDQPLFPDVLGGFRNPANLRRALRAARGTETLAWITWHNSWETAATILDDAALSSMTQDVYMGRRDAGRCKVTQAPPGPPRRPRTGTPSRSHLHGKRMGRVAASEPTSG
jgi:hypothetical protein